MNWNRVIGGGIAAGIVLWLAGFVMHGVILGKTYERYTEAFTQTQANPLHFLAISVALGVFAAVLFGKTRASWAAGAKGGRWRKPRARMHRGQMPGGASSGNGLPHCGHRLGSFMDALRWAKIVSSAPY